MTVDAVTWRRNCELAATEHLPEAAHRHFSFHKADTTKRDQGQFSQRISPRCPEIDISEDGPKVCIPVLSLFRRVKTSYISCVSKAYFRDSGVMAEPSVGDSDGNASQFMMNHGWVLSEPPYESSIVKEPSETLPKSYIKYAVLIRI